MSEPRSKYYKLGKDIVAKIHSYIDDRQQKHLNEIFSILTEIAIKILYRRYKSVDPHILDESANQIAEDVLMSIYRRPEHYVNDDNESFYPYYKFVIKLRMGEVLASLHKIQTYIVPIDVTDETDYDCYLLSPDDHLAKQDRYIIFVNLVLAILKSCPRFRAKSSYLMWPLIVSLLYEDDREGSCAFDSLDFRDRVGLRIMLSQLHDKKRLLREAL